MFPAGGIVESVPQITTFDNLKHYKTSSHWNKFFNKMPKITSEFEYQKYNATMRSEY